LKNRWRGGVHTVRVIVASVLFLFACQTPVSAADRFGAPQPVARETGGLHTAIGYSYLEDKYEKGREYVVRRNQIYSELGYGARNWDAYGRIGISELRINDFFRSTALSTTTSRDDFTDQWNLFGTLGVKGFYPLSDLFGVGAFVQGSYYFRDFNDSVWGTRGGVPYHAEVKLKDLWDVNFGLAFQATIPGGIRLYAGPYLYYSEGRISPSSNIPGVAFSEGGRTLKNETILGGFAGTDVPLGRGFRLNLEGQYSERLSVGAAVTYSY